MTIEITDAMVEAAQSMTCRAESDDCIREALSEVLSMPKVRDAIYADVRREIEAKLKAAGVTGYSVEGL